MFPLKDNIPTEGFPLVTVALIAANVLMYFFFQHGTISLGTRAARTTSRTCSSTATSRTS